MSLSKYTLLGKNLLVKRKQAETQTKGGIYLPDAATKNPPLEGEIVAIGLDVKLNYLKVGTSVIFDAFAGNTIMLDDKPYLIMDEADILIIKK